MLSQLYEMPSCYKAVEISPYTTILSPVDSVVDGVLVKRSEYKSISVKDNFGSFNIFDFAIANVLETGSTNLLRPVTMVNPDVAGITIKMDNFLRNEEAS